MVFFKCFCDCVVDGGDCDRWGGFDDVLEFKYANFEVLYDGGEFFIFVVDDFDGLQHFDEILAL